jgi:transposase-like protein
MSQKSYQRYTPEFKEQALGLLSLGKPVADVAQELQISSNLLYSWRSQSQRTPCVRCAAKMPASRPRTTF